MKYRISYKSSLGEILILADEQGVTDLNFTKDSKNYRKEFFQEAVEVTKKDLESEEVPSGLKKVYRNIANAIKWLNVYFDGEEPEKTPNLHLEGTDFQRAVWEKLLEIPYGVTTTYGEIAKELGSDPRGVGSAVGRNPVSLIVPCHRVIGSDGSLVGYGGGLKRKKSLLVLEGVYEEI